MKIKQIVDRMEKKLNEEPRKNPFSNKPMFEKSPRASKKDIQTVVEYWITGDYSKVEQTKLFQKQGGKYCRLLELLNKANIERQ